MVTLDAVNNDELLEDDFLDEDSLEGTFMEDIDVDTELATLSAIPPISTIGRYLSDISHYPRVSAEEETRLATLIQAGIKAKEQLTEANRVELTPLIEEGQAARTKLINANYKLVVAMAKRFFSRATASFTNMDIIQSGNLGLMRAADKFDPDKGFKFSTYATHWIKQAIRRELANNNSTIRLPVHVQDDLFQLYRLEQSSTSDMTVKEMATKLHMTEAKVENLLQIRDASHIAYLDKPNISLLDEPTPLLEAIASDTLTPEQVNKLANHDDILHEVLYLRLTDRELYVISRRFGLVDGKAITLEALGAELGVTRERIRQIQSKAIHKLRSTRTKAILRSLLK